MKLATQTTLALLLALENRENVAGMARFGINPENTLGISVAKLRQIAKDIGQDHTMALELWDTGIHEARILASFIADPAQLTEDVLDRWVLDFDSWDVCDQVCGKFAQTPFAYSKASQWSSDRQTFVKRAGFVLMATLAVHDKSASDEQLAQFLPIIVQEATDERNYVKKAVNWALRQIGKRSLPLNSQAIASAQQIQKINIKAARWIAADAIRELTSPSVQERLLARARRQMKVQINPIEASND